MAEHRIVTTEAALDDLVAELLDQPRYAVDTEFHRERTYYPKVALVQIAWETGIALVDPLAVSLQPLAKVLAGDGLAVMHAATQDLEVLDLACETLPTRLFDTQLAAGFLGYSTPSLVSLLQAELKVAVGKGDRLTDWLRRPLGRRVRGLRQAVGQGAPPGERLSRLARRASPGVRSGFGVDQLQ